LPQGSLVVAALSHCFLLRVRERVLKGQRRGRVRRWESRLWVRRVAPLRLDVGREGS